MWRAVACAVATMFLLLSPTAARAVDAVEEPAGPQETAIEAPPASAPTPDLMTLLGSATEDQRERMLRFIRNRYPDLSTELLALLQSHHPGIFIELEDEISNLIATRYPRLAVDVQRILQKRINEHHPQVRQETAELIARSYPDIIDAMQQVGEGDVSTRVARLIRERHRQLLDDVLLMLRNRYPTLLVEVRREVLVKTPALLADVALVIANRYPELSLKVTLILVERYPELLPGILKILAPAAEAEAAGG